MWRFWTIGLMALALASAASGCIQIMRDSSDESPNESLPEESVGANEGGNETAPVGPPTPTPLPTPPTPASSPTLPAPVTSFPNSAPTPTTPTPVASTPTTVPTPTTTPPPAEPATPPPTPVPTPPSTPEPTPTPTPTPTPATAPTPEPWPREGSGVTYSVESGASSPDGYYSWEANTTVVWTYSNGDWKGACDGALSEQTAGNRTNSELHETFTVANPPHWPLFATTTPPAVGQLVTGWGISACSIEKIDYDLEYSGPSQTVVGGATLPTFTAKTPNDGVPRDLTMEWLQGTGLVTNAHYQWHYSYAFAELRSTDAPN